jgi:hypothetical protein
MSLRGMQIIELGGDCEAGAVMAAQAFPRLAGFFFGLFISHRDGPDSHMRDNPVPPAPYERA